jgi:tRNA-specific 2-thiouridylase
MLLREQGRRVRAVTLRLWPGDEPRSCCSPAAVARARACAHALGIAFEEVDDEQRFRQLVVEPFVQAYLDGETPNPCADCNRFRLADLVEWAVELGASSVATGHYARVVWRAGQPFVARARHARKDQSYMLWRVSAETVAHLEFPLGELSKDEVRRRATEAGLPAAREPESQDVCFAPAGYQHFVQSWGVDAREGHIVDRGGRVLGVHRGQWAFTVGQRRGLRLAAAEPLYVLERRGATNEVVVGPREQLEADSFLVRELVDRGLAADGLLVQLRYRASAVAVAAVEHLGAGCARVHLRAPTEAPAPGQSAVFYDGDVVVGGGVVDQQQAASRAASPSTVVARRIEAV